MMRKEDENHLNRNLTPFNRGWFEPKHSDSQVNGETEQTQQMIVTERDAVKRNKR